MEGDGRVSMRGKQPLTVIALGVVALLAAAYFGFRPRTPHADARPSPVVADPATHNHLSASSAPNAHGDAPETTPARLAKRDNSAALFFQLKQCFYASRELLAAKSLTDCRFYEGKPEYQEAYAQCLNGWRNAPNSVAAAESALSACGDTSDIQRRYFEVTRAAAKKGDPDAQLCYLEGDFGETDGRPIVTEADVEEYKQVSPEYVDAAFKRGDWRIVYLLDRRSFHPGMGPVALLEGIGRPETIYRMTRLLRLGASGPYATALESDLEGMRHPVKPENAVPPDTIKEGDAWANHTYINHFSGVPGLAEAPVICRPERGRPGSLEG
jgi:hypothetical protein